MSSFLLRVVDVSLGVVGLYLLKKVLSKSPSAPLPPGPKKRFLIGNLLDVPTDYAWYEWAKHKQLFGPLSCLSVFGMHIIIINDLQTVLELFDKRSVKYSDRPRIVFGGEMCGWDRTLALLRYGDRLREYRKTIHQVIGTRATLSQFHDLIEAEARKLIWRLTKSPEKFLSHIQTTAGAIILKISHGYTIEPLGPDPLVDLAEEGIAQISMAAQPGAFIVDILPFLRYVPDWVPGTAFKRIARRFKATVTEIVEKPYSFVKQQMAAGTNSPSYVSNLIEQHSGKSGSGPTKEEEDVIKWSASSLFTGGADTTVSALQTFYLAMTLNPEVQRRAQAEIDSVIGSDRLPSFKDREDLPYINALVKETLRWHPVTPMGLPHVPIEDDVYNGYFIPKGSVIMANIWQFTHDPEVYSEPDSFKPERHIATEDREAELDPYLFIFGFGRRVCIGKELADNSLFIEIATTLALLNIEKAKDANGNIITPPFAFSAGTIVHPKEFQCAIKPRSERAIQLIQSIEEEHPLTGGDAHHLVGLEWDRSDLDS